VAQPPSAVRTPTGRGPTFFARPSSTLNLVLLESGGRACPRAPRPFGEAQGPPEELEGRRAWAGPPYSARGQQESHKTAPCYHNLPHPTLPTTVDGALGPILKTAECHAQRSEACPPRTGSLAPGRFTRLGRASQAGICQQTSKSARGKLRRECRVSLS
jgi:hypothetical protein